MDPIDLLKRCLPATIAGLALIVAAEATEPRLVESWSPLPQSAALTVVGAAA